MLHAIETSRFHCVDDTCTVGKSRYHGLELRNLYWNKLLRGRFLNSCLVRYLFQLRLGSVEYSVTAGPVPPVRTCSRTGSKNRNRAKPIEPKKNPGFSSIGSVLTISRCTTPADFFGWLKKDVLDMFPGLLETLPSCRDLCIWRSMMKLQIQYCGKLFDRIFAAPPPLNHRKFT